MRSVGIRGFRSSRGGGFDVMVLSFVLSFVPSFLPSVWVLLVRSLVLLLESSIPMRYYYYYYMYYYQYFSLQVSLHHYVYRGISYF